MNYNNTAVNADFNDLQIELFTIEERTSVIPHQFHVN